MSLEPYRSAERVFWIVDNGSSHRSDAAATRLQVGQDNAFMIHLPIHASWLNQIEDLLLDPAAQGPHARRHDLTPATR